MNFSKEFDDVKGSVVQVFSFDRNTKTVETGSGVVIGNGTYVLTCAHCVRHGEINYVTFSGDTQPFFGFIKWIDEKSDVAILSFNQAIGKGATVGKSSSVKIGNETFVVGFPMHINEITAMSANIASFAPFEAYDLIRIDSSVNHGNSGGPMFDSDGKLLGIVTAKHGKLSKFLEQAQKGHYGVTINVSGFDVVEIFRRLIKEMGENLNLGIGYVIPIDFIVKNAQEIFEYQEN